MSEVTTALPNRIFNTNKDDYGVAGLFLGQDPGLFDTVNKKYPEVWKLYKQMKSLDWDENEFDFSSCVADFKTCDKSTYDIMIKTLAWQWEADSVAGRTIVPILANFVPAPEAAALYGRIGDNENLHAATYSEIVRNSFEDPSDILDEVLRVEQAMDRLKTVAQVMDKAYDTSHKLALGMVDRESQETYNDLFMFLVALLCLERIQFMASFAVTFGICQSGMFQPIGKAVQKIAQDEFEVHVQAGLEVLRTELKTERGRTALEQCKPLIVKLINEVVKSEDDWTEYAFSEGRELTGVTVDRMVQWNHFGGTAVANFFGLQEEVDFELVHKNPLPYMNNWLDISKNQASPQEEDNNQYKVNVIARNDTGKKVAFDMDF